MTPTQKQLRMDLGLDCVYAARPWAMRPACVHCGEVPLGRGFHNTANGLCCDKCRRKITFTIDVLFRVDGVWGFSVLHGVKVG